MFAKLLHKAIHQPHPSPKQNGGLTASDLDIRLVLHHGIPQTASIMAFDPVQRLLAIGTLDGRIKIIGNDNIEGFLISPKKLPYKFLEFLCNHGFLIAISNDSDIQVWDLKNQALADALQWESNITAFSVIYGTCLMYIGDDEGSISVLKYDDMQNKILKLPYHISVDALTEAACITFPGRQSVVGILPQPYTCGNRVLIAYEHGVIILWDISGDQIIAVKGHHGVQKVEKAVGSLASVENEQQRTSTDIDQEKEICSLCWVCKSGSILAVGYIDGDILLWNLSSETKKGRTPSGNVVRLQLSSEVRRLPVIVLHWSPDAKSTNDCSGFLFIYGGVEIGSEEVITVLHLDWTSGAESVNCVSRVDLTLNGSFANMVLIPENGIAESSSTSTLAAFILTNPGQLHVYDWSIFSNSETKGERFVARPDNFPAAIPTVDPSVTISKLSFILTNRSELSALVKRARKQGAILPTLSRGSKWLLTGGISGTYAEDAGIEKIYIAGYLDGSIRIWDATFPVLTLLSVIEKDDYHLEGEKLVSDNSPISALDFYSPNFILAAGTDSGLVHIYFIKESCGESQIRLLTNGNLEVHTIPHKGIVHHTAIVSLVNSAVQALNFVHSGASLAIAFKCSQILVIEIESLNVLFHVDHTFGPNTGITSLLTEVIPFPSSTSKHPGSEKSGNMEEEALFILTKDAHIVIASSNSGSMICTKPLSPKKESTAVSMHIVGRTISRLRKDASQNTKSVSEESNQLTGEKAEIEVQAPRDLSNSKVLTDACLLLCCEDALRLYSLESVIENEKKCLKKVKLDKTCCWSATFEEQTENISGVLLLYQTGDLEIRSLPSLEVLERSSLMSILRWGYKRDMNKIMSSCCDGQVSLVSGSELAFISILARENGFRMPDTFPSLHDEVLAAAAHAAIQISSIHKKKQDVTSSGFLGGIIKGFKGVKEETDGISSGKMVNFLQQLEGHFCRIPFSSSPATGPVEDKQLTIDDIEIDDPQPLVSSSFQAIHDRKEAKREREKLFDGATTSSKPTPRTPQEILTQYKFGGDAAAAAAHARDKLVQRQEKLQRAQERSEELRNNAQDFESLAKELAKTMEKRRFWRF